MTIISNVGQVRQTLRTATANDHHRVDTLYSKLILDEEADYRIFLRAHARALGTLEPVINPSTPRLPLLCADLAALGESLPEALPLVPVDTDAWRWGVRYALEGSRLGGAMLARRVGPTFPHAYLSAVHEKGGWVAFQDRMARAAQAGDADWLEQAISGAQAAFAVFAQAARQEGCIDHG